MTDLAAVLARYGAEESRVLSLRGELQPATVGYADIVNATRDRPDAVVHEAGRVPVAYVVDGRSKGVNSETVARLRRVLAFRGDSGFLTVVYPGRLDLFDVSLIDLTASNEPFRSIEETDEQAAQLFPQLDIVPEVVESHGHAIHETLRVLMKDAIDALHSPRTAKLAHLVSRQDALSLVGRAVFVRFLFDRGLLSSENVHEISSEVHDPRELFDSAKLMCRTFRWLDETFNGDLLPVGFPVDEGEFSRRIQVDGWTSLGNILRDAPGGQLSLEAAMTGPVTWSGLDFSRIPVGVLSQVYEQQAHDWDPNQRREKSVYYTPSAIATFMVTEVFREFPVAKSTLGSLRILDPAVGGGVFLVAAFRELVAKYWHTNRERPSTALLRNIVYQQLRGFDVEQAALRFSALSLYLAAIELDPEPRPLQRLRFAYPLIGTTLIHVGGTGAAGLAGSLGSNVGPHHDEQYDVVIGNPPWTSSKVKQKVQREILGVLRPIANEVGLGHVVSNEQTILPDGNPDVGFLWRAKRWCKPGGRIALVLHARLLFKQTQVGCSARAALLRAFSWTGVLNGAAVRKTEVWPNVSAPFALVFGINERPGYGDGFYFFSPHLEASLNRRGRMRIDAKDALPIRLESLEQTPFLLKALFRGSTLDLSVVRTVELAGPRLEDYWLQTLGLTLGHGYQVALSSGRRDASFLLNLPNVTHDAVGTSPEIKGDEIPKFRHGELCWPRNPEIYKGPLILVRKSIPADDHRLCVFISQTDAAYSESFYGLSTYGHVREVELAKYVALVLAAPLMRWYSLMTSGQYGVERDALYFEDVKRFPIPPYDSVPESLKNSVSELWDKYVSARKVTPKHEDWARDLYGLSADDWRVVQDTLAVGGPQPSVARRASNPPSQAEVDEYRIALRSILQDALGTSLSVELDAEPGFSPWLRISVSVSSSNDGRECPPNVVSAVITGAADRYSASKVRVISGKSVFIYILRQYRYWTQSRARLEALEMLRDSAVMEALGS